MKYKITYVEYSILREKILDVFCGISNIGQDILNAGINSGAVIMKIELIPEKVS